MIQCPQCRTTNQNGARFCSGCGIEFVYQTQPTPLPVKKNKLSTPAIIAIAALGMCGFCGLIGSIGNKANTNTAQTNAVGIAATPIPTNTPPPTFAELKEKTIQVLNFERYEYKKEDLNQFDTVLQPLRAIPKEDKNYKEAQTLLKKVIDKSAKIGAEVVVLGEKPSETDLHIAFNHYLRARLNDYDSSEYVDYSPAQKVVIKGEPFWMSVLRLRAKNAFGGYLVKDVKMYIRQKEVVLSDGL